MVKDYCQEERVDISYITENDEKELVIYRSPTFLFNETEKCFQKDLYSSGACENQIRKMLRDGRFGTKESFDQCVEELISHTAMHIGERHMTKVKLLEKVFMSF